MQHLYSIDHLFAHLQHCLKRKALVVIVKQVFKAGAQNIHQHYVVLAFGCEGVDLNWGISTLGSPTTGPKEERYLYILAS